VSIFTISQADEELVAVKSFQTHAQLIAVRMKSFSALSAGTAPEIDEGLQLDLRHSVTRAETAESHACFDVKLEMAALGDKDPAKMLFRVECCFELTYALAAGYAPTQDELDAFKKGNAIFHCWPYMREFVQNATQRMGLAVPPIPLLRLEPLPPAAGSAEETQKRRVAAPSRKLGPATKRIRRT
jgi:preprotein translocase subunit SecB